MGKEQVVLILGAQWGDEGKGKLVDILGSQFQLCCRFNGGSNAGHTIVANGKKYAFHLLPSGMLHKQTTCLLGNGVVVNIENLFSEIKAIQDDGIDCSNLKISDRAQIVFDFHLLVDGLSEDELGTSKIGTTKQGIGPSTADKIHRKGLRIGDLWSPQFKSRLETLLSAHQKRFPNSEILRNYDVEAAVKKYQEYAAIIRPYVIDTIPFVNDAYNQGKKILLEGANAAMLDIDFGSYPYVTSSCTTVGGAFSGLGISPQKLDYTIGIVKAYTTRVGGGPFPTELHDDIGERIRSIGLEVGTTTGRPRRCGWLDLVVLKYTTLLNGYNVFNLTKIDVLTGFEKIKICVNYLHKGSILPSFPGSLDTLIEVEPQYIEVDGWTEDISKAKDFGSLPNNCQKYVRLIEEHVGVPIRWIGVGPGREEMIEL